MNFIAMFISFIYFNRPCCVAKVDIIGMIVKNEIARLNPVSLGTGINMSLGNITEENYLNILEETSNGVTSNKNLDLHLRMADYYGRHLFI
jgi:hypothetical protein